MAAKSGSRGRFGKFNPDKHPRGFGGRFTSTPDDPKISKSRTRRRSSAPSGRGNATEYRKVAKQVAKLAKEAKTEQEIQQARRDLMGEMSAAQRKRMVAHIVAKAKAAKAEPAKSDSEEKRLAGLAKHHEVTVDHARTKSDNKLNTDKALKETLKETKKATQKELLKLTEGKLEANIPSHAASFRKDIDEAHDYTVRYKDAALSLNKYKQVLHYEGDPVKGVPPMLRDPSQASDEKLIKTLTTAVKQTRKGNALKVDPEEHDLVGEEYLDPRKGYKEWQIHHIDQWCKNVPRLIEADYAAGKITAEERQNLYAENLRPSPDPKRDYEIAPLPKGERAFVLVPGGLHEAQTPLFFANHPMMVHPTTGKQKMFGIPDRTDKFLAAEGRNDGESRAWFDSKFRSQFWKEYYKKEATTLLDEVNTRLASGKLSERKLQQLLDKST